MARAFALYLLDARTEIWPPLNLGSASGPADDPTRPISRSASATQGDPGVVVGIESPSCACARKRASRYQHLKPRARSLHPRDHTSPLPRLDRVAFLRLPAVRFVLAVVIFCCCRSSVWCCCFRCCSSSCCSLDPPLVGALGLCCCWPTHHSWTSLLGCPDRFPGRSRKSGPARSGGPLFLESPGVERNLAGGWASSLFFSGDEHLEMNT